MDRKGIMALSPLLVFVALYLVTSIVAKDFYKVPITVAFMVSSIYAVAAGGGVPLRHRIDTFSRGAATSDMMLMIWIFVLAGAFAGSAQAMGCVDATVNLTLHAMPDGMLLAGLFLASCIISLAIGTSVGTIVALAPIAAGIARNTGADVPMLVAIVVGGSFFGDNLSFISDTTVAATSTQGCRMSDKFRVNSLITLPAAAIALVAYVFAGQGIDVPTDVPGVEIAKVLPYAAVLITAVMGMNVMAVLTLGIALTGIIGVADGSFGVFAWFQAMGDGITSMGELIIITMLAGGMLELIKERGGIDAVINALTRHVSTKRGAELSIAALVAMVNVCTANNTVAIITVGGIAKRIGDKFGVDNRKSASILDTMSCAIQGLIPYGAQVLMGAGLAAISPVSILPHLYYPALIGITTIVAICLRYPRKYS